MSKTFEDWLKKERDIGVEYTEAQLWAARIAYRDATAAERAVCKPIAGVIEHDLKQHGVCIICDAGLGLVRHPFEHKDDCAYIAAIREETEDENVG